MSRHRNLGGWIAEANDDFDGEDEDGYYENVAGGGEHSHDEQVDHESGLARSLPAIDAAVRAVYYGDGVVYDGWIVDQSPDGMVYISFEGYEEEEPQLTDMRDLEGSWGEDAPSGVAVDMDTHLLRLSEVTSILGGEVSEREATAALTKCGYDSGAAIDFLLGWVSDGRPASKLPIQDKTPKKKMASAPPTPLNQTPKTPKVAKEKGTPAGTKGTPKTPSSAAAKKAAGGRTGQKSGQKGAAATPGKGTPSGMGTWGIAREMDSLGLGMQGGDDADGDLLSGAAVEEGPAFDEILPEEDDGRPTISLVVVGHVDAGKSTLNGHLLYALGCVDKKVMHKHEKDSKNMGKGSFAFAWLLDGHAEERERGVTIDVGVNTFVTENRRIQLLDAPGHKDFVPNMISGAAQADAAVLVVDGSTGEFESGFERGGQTREHTVLVRSLGVQQLIVAVNKMDNVDYSQERYEHIKEEIWAFLKRAGYRKDDVYFIPVSGYKGENLLERKEEALNKWYCGPTLVELIDKLRPPVHPVEMGLRMVVSDIFKTVGLGLCLAGRLEAGTVTVGEQVVFRPGDITAIVKAKAGESVTLAINGDKEEMENVRVGSVLSNIESPIPMVTSFLAQILTFDIAIPLTIGYQAVMYWQSVNEPVTLTRLLCTIDKTSGEIGKKRPRAIGPSSTAIVQVTCNRAMCLERFADYKQLGRFTLREGGSSIAAGTVMKLLP